MTFFDSLAQRFYALDERERRIYTIVCLIGIFVVTGGIHFLLSRSIVVQRDRMKKLNTQRSKAQTLFASYDLVKQQQQHVRDVLQKDPTFRIKEFYTDVIQTLGLASKLSKPAEVSSPRDLGNGYAEITLESSLTNMNTKDVVELVYAVEKNERIFTKELVISQVKPGTVDTTLVIATLQPKEALA